MKVLSDLRFILGGRSGYKESDIGKKWSDIHYKAFPAGQLSQNLKNCIRESYASDDTYASLQEVARLSLQTTLQPYQDYFLEENLIEEGCRQWSYAIRIHPICAALVAAAKRPNNQDYIEELCNAIHTAFQFRVRLQYGRLVSESLPDERYTDFAELQSLFNHFREEEPVLPERRVTLRVAVVREYKQRSAYSYSLELSWTPLDDLGSVVLARHPESLYFGDISRTSGKQTFLQATRDALQFAKGQQWGNWEDQLRELQWSDGQGKPLENRWLDWEEQHGVVLWKLTRDPCLEPDIPVSINSIAGNSLGAAFATGLMFLRLGIAQVAPGLLLTAGITVDGEITRVGDFLLKADLIRKPPLTLINPLHQLLYARNQQETKDEAENAFLKSLTDDRRFKSFGHISEVVGYYLMQSQEQQALRSRARDHLKQIRLLGQHAPVTVDFIQDLRLRPVEEKTYFWEIPHQEEPTISHPQMRDGKPLRLNPESLSRQAVLEELLKPKSTMRFCALAGPPGVGKTSLLHKMAADQLDNPVWLPVFISLRAWAGLYQSASRYASLSAYLEAESAGDSRPMLLTQGVWENALKRGALLLLDGLDEVNDAFLKVIATALRTYEKCRVVVTCRTASRKRLDEIGFGEKDRTDHIYSPTEFGTEQRKTFLYRYARAYVGGSLPKIPSDDSDLSLHDAKQLQDEIAKIVEEMENRDTFALFLKNPLLFSLLAFLRQQGEDKFPHSRTALYDAVTMRLLESPETPANSGQDTPLAMLWSHDPVAQHRILAGVARRMMQNRVEETEDTFLTAPESRIRDYVREILVEWQETDHAIIPIAAGSIAKAICHCRLFTGSTDTHYSFLHSTFREYFAACDLQRLAQEVGFDRDAPYQDGGEGEMLDWPVKQWKQTFTQIDTAYNRGDLRQQRLAQRRLPPACAVLALLDQCAWLEEWEETFKFLAGKMNDPTLLLEVLMDSAVARDDRDGHRASLAALCLPDIQHHPMDPELSEDVSESDTPENKSALPYPSLGDVEYAPQLRAFPPETVPFVRNTRLEKIARRTAETALQKWRARPFPPIEESASLWRERGAIRRGTARERTRLGRAAWAAVCANLPLTYPYTTLAIQCAITALPLEDTTPDTLPIGEDAPEDAKESHRFKQDLIDLWAWAREEDNPQEVLQALTTEEREKLEAAVNHHLGNGTPAEYRSWGQYEGRGNALHLLTRNTRQKIARRFAAYIQMQIEYTPDREMPPFLRARHFEKYPLRDVCQTLTALAPEEAQALLASIWDSSQAASSCLKQTAEENYRRELLRLLITLGAYLPEDRATQLEYIKVLRSFREILEFKGHAAIHREASRAILLLYRMLDTVIPREVWDKIIESLHSAVTLGAGNIGTNSYMYVLYELSGKLMHSEHRMALETLWLKQISVLTSEPLADTSHLIFRMERACYALGSVAVVFRPEMGLPDGIAQGLLTAFTQGLTPLSHYIAKQFRINGYVPPCVEIGWIQSASLLYWGGASLWEPAVQTTIDRIQEEPSPIARAVLAEILAEVITSVPPDSNQFGAVEILARKAIETLDALPLSSRDSTSQPKAVERSLAVSLATLAERAPTREARFDALNALGRRTRELPSELCTAYYQIFQVLRWRVVRNAKGRFQALPLTALQVGRRPKIAH